MERVFSTPVVAADAAAVTEVVAALEASLYPGQSTFSQADLEEEWSVIELERDARVVRDGDRVVGYGVVQERGELWRVQGYVHPDAHGRGIGRLLATGLEEDAARWGARRVENGVLEADSAARRLLESLGYGAVRVFREMRIELEAPPPAPEWPSGLRVVPFEPERDARSSRVAHGGGKAWARRSSPTRSRASGSAASTASDSASTPRATAAPSASTSAPE